MSYEVKPITQLLQLLTARSLLTCKKKIFACFIVTWHIVVINVTIRDNFYNFNVDHLQIKTFKIILFKNSRAYKVVLITQAEISLTKLSQSNNLLHLFTPESPNS